MLRKRLFKGVVLITSAIALSGCAAALVGGAIYHSSQTNSQRAAFTSDFQKNNLERESKRLKPLDWCTEAYKFDSSWAKDKPECTARIQRYENGDKSALSI
jgi:hypothetical protein